MSNIIEAEVFVTKVWPPKGKYFAFNCEELKSDSNQYGRVSAPITLYKKIKQNGTYRIAYHETEEGYLNMDTLLTDVAKDPPPRSPTNPKDSDRMGRYGMTNTILSSIEGMTISDWLQVPPKQIAAIIVKCAEASAIAERIIAETDITKADISSGKRKERQEEMNDEIPE
jgi:hypothetical protein